MSLLTGAKISKIVEKWYITDPLLFAIWTTHKTKVNTYIQTIRVGSGWVEYNPTFIHSLSSEQLHNVIFYEALRILLKHPYARKKEIAQLSYLASNITLQEYYARRKVFPSAHEVFQTHQYDRKHFEFYYDKLIEKSKNRTSSLPTESSLLNYLDESVCGVENTKHWDMNDYWSKIINHKIEDAILSNSWGNISGNLQQTIIANLKPKLNYRDILKSFRASILSTNRVLTRMKPSRRYGFQYLGSRRDLKTKLLFAVDVSGSVEDKDLQKAFSVINRLFKYGIEEVNVIQFDTKIKGNNLILKKAIQEVKVLGRGGTCFQSVMDYIEKEQQYDGAIIFTDGYAPIPQVARNRKTRILWLFNNEANYEKMRHQLSPIGKVAFLKEK